MRLLTILDFLYHTDLASAVTVMDALTLDNKKQLVALAISGMETIDKVEVPSALQVRTYNFLLFLKENLPASALVPQEVHDYVLAG